MTELQPDLAERARAIETLVGLRVAGTARLLRTNLLPVSVPDSYPSDDVLVCCGEHPTTHPGVTIPELLDQHLLLDHAAEVDDGIELCDICQNDFGVELRTALVELAGRPPLIGRRVDDGSTVLIGGRLVVRPFARLCQECGVLWAEDSSDPIIIRV